MSIEVREAHPSQGRCFEVTLSSEWRATFLYREDAERYAASLWERGEARPTT